MTIADVKKVLSVPGVTVHYDHAPVGTKVPYVTYTCHADNNFFADDKVYQKIRSMRAVLYSTKKDEKLETLIESALDEAEIPWNMTDEFENEQKVFMTIYEAEVI
jgi:hypothetical protein